MTRPKIWLSALLTCFVAQSSIYAEDFQLSGINRNVPDIHPENVGSFEWPELASLDVSKTAEYAKQLLLTEHPELESSDLFVTYASVQYDPGMYPRIHVVLADVSDLEVGEQINSRVPFYDVWVPAKGSLRAATSVFSGPGVYPSTLFLVARDDLAHPVFWAHDPLDQRLTVRWRGLGRIELAQLWSVILREQFDQSLVDRFETLRADDRRGDWFYRVPDDLISQLAEISPREFERIADAWTNSVGDDGPIIPQEYVPDLLRQLRILARYANESRAAVVLWTQL
jgi:hypothetical protein